MNIGQSDAVTIGEYNEQGELMQGYYYSPQNSLANAPVAIKHNDNGITQTSCYQNDHLNTPQMLTRPNGSVVWQGQYDAFGEVTQTNTQVSNPIRFPGQYYDQETGLHYNWNRYYDPEIGRYVTSDPIGLGGGLNTFGYGYQNPLYWTDPEGLSSAVLTGPKPIPLPAWAGPAGAVLGAGQGGYWLGGKLYPYIAQPLGDAIDYICLSDSTEPDKPYEGQTPDDKPEDFRRGNQGDRINENDGSI